MPQASKGEPSNSVFSTDGTLISASAALHSTKKKTKKKAGGGYGEGGGGLKFNLFCVSIV